MIQNAFEFTDDDKQRAASNTERVLQLLKRGPAVSTDLIGVTHRFSACVRNLREQGYTITVEKAEGGTSIHTLVSYTPLVEVTDEMKLAYYETEHWFKTRLSRFSLDDFRCCHCRGTDGLQVHHWVYELFAESIEDLVTLCRTCHERIHEYDSVKLHFPKYVSQDVARRLQESTT